MISDCGGSSAAGLDQALLLKGHRMNEALFAPETPLDRQRILRTLLRLTVKKPLQWQDARCFLGRVLCLLLMYHIASCCQLLGGFIYNKKILRMTIRKTIMVYITNAESIETYGVRFSVCPDDRQRAQDCIPDEIQKIFRRDAPDCFEIYTFSLDRCLLPCRLEIKHLLASHFRDSLGTFRSKRTTRLAQLEEKESILASGYLYIYSALQQVDPQIPRKVLCKSPDKKAFASDALEDRILP